MNNTAFRFFFPSLLILVSWAFILLLREFSLIGFYDISTEASTYLFAFFLFFISGSILGSFLCLKLKTDNASNYVGIDVQRRANFIIIFSYVAIALSVVKFISLIGDISFSISDITNLRLSRARDSDDVKGGLVSGVLATAFSGFTIVAYLFAQYFKQYLTKNLFTHLVFVFVLGIMCSFLTGGRWAATIALIAAYLSVKIFYFVKRKSFDVATRKNNSLVSKASIVKFFFVVLILYIFSVMFLARAMNDEQAFEMLVGVLDSNFPGIYVLESHRSFLLNNTHFIPIYFVVSLFQYYLGHSFFQFDVLFSSEYPKNAPYMFAYQGYVYVAFINKLGLDVISIQSILTEIINPGVYFSLAGSLYLDFGLWGGLLSVFILSVLGSFFWGVFLKKKSFVMYYISIIYFILIMFSPVLSIVPTGIYPSLLMIGAVLFLFSPRFNK